MAGTIPDPYKDLFTKRAFANLATLMKDGSPQVTPVWCDYNGSQIWINSANRKLKDKNLRRDKRVARSIQDPDNAYRYLAVQSVVEKITESGADQHIDTMAKKYLGKDRYPYRAAGEVRVIYKIRPEKVSTYR